MTTISNKQRATEIGILIIAAYSMLAYTVTENIPLGVITDIISGLAVIGIPLLLFPHFNTYGNRKMNLAYLVSRIIEGLLMIIGGLFIMNPALEGYRNLLYIHIHIYFFIAGALFLYVLFLRTQIIPKFISLWGIVATILLFIVTIVKVVEVDLPLLNVLYVPIITNELFLAVWLMVKGFNLQYIKT
jgi:heme/copper-type cytochrome/quinol oxidase subunit 4